MVKPARCATARMGWVGVLFAVLVLPLAGAVPTGKPEEAGMSSERLRRIGELTQRHIDARNFSGAVTLVARNGRIVHHEAHGLMDLDAKKPMQKDAIFRIMSMTKPVVGVAVLMMMEEGKVRLNDPISRFIPEYADLKVAVPQAAPAGRGGAPAGGAAQGGRGTAAAPRFYTMPAERQITVRDVLTHTSGLTSGTISNFESRRVARKAGETLATYLPRLGTVPLEFQPGTRWAYSPGPGFETLGRVLEIVSGMPLDEFFARRIFGPLGMRAITFWPSESQWPRVATVYQRQEQRLVKAVMPNDTLGRNVYFRGSGGLYSTAESYVPFGIMLANGGELGGVRLLSRKSVEMLGAVHVADTLPGRPPGEGYGLSVRVVTNHAARGTLLSDGTYGWSGAQGTHFFVDPKEQLVGVLMVQTPNNEVRNDFENLVAQAIVD
jgi:CubicO group peptidase (beta-lactamase class C family)